MPYEVRLHHEIVKAPSRMSPELRSRIIRALRNLQKDPFQSRSGADIARLIGTKGSQDLFRLRVGDYRAIYAVEDNIVYVTDLFRREKGYSQSH